MVAKWMGLEAPRNAVQEKDTPLIDMVGQTTSPGHSQLLDDILSVHAPEQSPTTLHSEKPPAPRLPRTLSRSPY